MSILFPHKQNQVIREKCPACGELHDVLRPLGIIIVMICPLIKDLIYLHKIVVNKETRDIVKKSLLGT